MVLRHYKVTPPSPYALRGQLVDFAFDTPAGVRLRKGQWEREFGMGRAVSGPSRRLCTLCLLNLAPPCLQ